MALGDVQVRWVEYNPPYGLNVMGEPVICTPEECVRCFYSTGLDVAAIGSFLLEK